MSAVWRNGIAEQTQVRDVAFGHVAQPVLVRGDPFEPTEGRDHPEQQGELRDLGEIGLAVDRGTLRIEACRQPVQDEPLDESR